LLREAGQQPQDHPPLFGGWYVLAKRQNDEKREWKIVYLFEFQIEDKNAVSTGIPSWSRFVESREYTQQRKSQRQLNYSWTGSLFGGCFGIILGGEQSPRGGFASQVTREE
jgi:hypothetical protein